MKREAPVLGGESISSDQREYERMKREAYEVMGGESISSDQKQYDRMKREQQVVGKSAKVSAYDSSMLDISSEEQSELSDVNIDSLYDKRYF